MIISTIELVNFGLYHGKHVVNFDYNPQKPVTLIGGLNGRGKTTLLDAITLGLYGRRALKYLQDERIKYSTYLYNHINKGVTYGATTSITITLVDSEKTPDVITICRSWEKPFKHNPEEVLTATRNGIVDDYLSKNWDYFVEEILPLNISRFFFFDNEKIAQIADDETFESVKESIRSLLGLTTIEQLITDIGKLSKRTQSDSQETDTNQMITEIEQLQTKIDQCDEEAKVMKEEADKYQSLIIDTRRQFDEESEKFWKAGGNLGLEKDKLQSELHEVKQSIRQFESNAMEIVCDPATPLLLCSRQLTSIQEKQRKDEVRRKQLLSAEVISTLNLMLDQTTEHSVSFIDEAKQFLSNAKNELCPTSEFSVVNKISDEASSLLLNLLKSYEYKLQSAIDLINELEKAKEISERIESHLEREVNDQAAQEIWAKIMKLNQEANQYEVSKQLAEEKLQRIEREREMHVSQRAKLLASSYDVQKSHGESTRLIRYSKMVIQVMESFKERLTEKRVHDLSDTILDCFTSMVGKTSMIHHIQIDPKTLEIKLIDFKNTELLKSQLSAGEKQLFAVSIIWGLAKCSGYEMPVIIDTPLGRLDSHHRQNFVEGYLPYASKQVVVLSTDEEINGRYLDLVIPYVNKTYTLVYNDESHSSTIVDGYFGGEVK